MTAQPVLPSKTDLVVMGRHRISLTDWNNMTDQERAEHRASVAYEETGPGTTKGTP